MIKKLIIVFVIIFLLVLFIALRSNTFEVHRKKVIKGGVEYERTMQIAHWDRFWKYIYKIPEKISKTVQKISRKWRKGTMEIG